MIFTKICFIKCLIITQLLKLIQSQQFDSRPHVVAENLLMDYVSLGVIFQKSALQQSLYSQNVGNDSVQKNTNLVNIVEDQDKEINQNNLKSNNTRLNLLDLDKLQQNVFYVLKKKTIQDNKIQLLIQLYQNFDFYLNTYNNFIKCIKLTLYCRDASFIDLVAEDVNDDLRFKYKNQNFEQRNEKSFCFNNTNFSIFISDYNEPFQLKILRKNTNTLLFSLDERFVMSDKYIHLKYQASSKFIFGLGERNYKFKLEFNNSLYTLWNRDVPQDIETADSKGGHNTYGSHPVYLMKDTDYQDENNQTDTHFHLIYLQNVNAMDIFLTKQQEIEYRITGGILDFKIIACDSPSNCVQRYNVFLGKQALMPLWAYGFHQSRWGYQNIDEVKQIIAEYNFIEFPVESIFIDIDYMINYNTFTVNQTIFPLNNYSIMKDIEKRIVPILDVGIGLENQTLQVRQDALYYNVGVKDLTHKIYIGRVWPGYTLFPDFQKPITKIFWQNYTFNFMKQNNISAFWLDMNEYANFCHGICEELYQNYRQSYNLDVELFVEGLAYQPGSKPLENMSLSLVSIHEESGDLEFNFHNINGYLHSQSTYKAVKYEMQNPLPFLISRSTIPGSGNYVSHWAGDNNSSYEFMAYSVSSLFNFHIFGIDFTGSDICGFMGNTTQELCNRWAQLGSLYPFSRNHNHEKLLSQEFFTFDEFGGALFSFRTKYSLLKYYYTLTLNNTYKIQPAFMNFANDSNLYLDNILETHIMIGQHLISVPVLKQGQNYYEIYFPQGRWQILNQNI
ncbi:glycosyl hydrolase family 31 protein (macronuclear) [Tetrahymena thermophila SB210]|uniref:Glycosyl hydrolase family 31 protein n=1 Tax=Tetrahymena thermophila (strain SB210) TaxID=312017 RepID=Q23PR8_TETTS|nr:glycosyl hydrolase family 31 protein [Tetrahymena thermophila SB210]EAR98617.2 glycosyl hydrolase family 31 protein [Tetrahymena thermophila SB210]|eukprot:XP_001018862.2 glycosyl hydrolase family 31 protein [Tetrahymena thermophila SB210]